MKRVWRLPAAAAMGHNVYKYMRNNQGNRVAAGSRFKTKYRQRYSSGRRIKRINRKYRRYVNKKRSLYKSKKRGDFMYITSKRSEKVELEFTPSTVDGSVNIQAVDMDTKWLGLNKEFHDKVDIYQNLRLKSVSWRFDNFKVRTILRTVTTEGTPPNVTTTTQEQVLEPGWIKMRYRHNKWNDASNPGVTVGTDDRVDENCRVKCITNCNDGFWGIFKPKNTIALTDRPLGTESINTVMQQIKTTSRNEDEQFYLSFWLGPESTLPKQFFVADPPVTRTAKYFIDCDFKCYTKWLCYKKKNNYG